jgi:predicted methyltransferase
VYDNGYYCAKFSANINKKQFFIIYVATPVNMKKCDSAKKHVIFRNKVFKTKTVLTQQYLVMGTRYTQHATGTVLTQQYLVMGTGYTQRTTGTVSTQQYLVMGTGYTQHATGTVLTQQYLVMGTRYTEHATGTVLTHQCSRMCEI